MIIHITLAQDWEKAKRNGAYLAPSLRSEGFIHCSTLQQTVDTANVFFKGKYGLVLLCLDEHKLNSPCKYESPIEGSQSDLNFGKLFPHIYGPINISSVMKVVDFPPDENGFFKLPSEIFL